MIEKSTLQRWGELAKRDDWHMLFVGSDIRLLLGEVERLRSALKAVLPYADNSDSPGGCNGKHPHCAHCTAIAQARNALNY